MGVAKTEQWSCLRAGMLCALLLLALPVGARIDISPRPVVIPLTWSGTNIIQAQDFCVESFAERRPPASTPVNYSVIAQGPLFITDGVNQIPVSLTWEDLDTGVVTPLADGEPTGEIMTGALVNCGGTSNGLLEVTLLNSDIVAVPPGVYSGTFQIAVRNSGAGRRRRRTDVTLDLTLPDSIRVSNLSDFPLGAYAGADINVVDDVCVFRASGGNYGVSISGTGTAGAYVLQNGTSVIPFSVTWDDGVGPYAMTPGTVQPNLINTVAGSDTCNNGAQNNAFLGVTVLAADVDAAATSNGAHVGTLIITVEMQ